jgi:glycerophosphoryl diester phosphodiesterase
MKQLLKETKIEKGFIQCSDNYYPLFFNLIKDLGYEELHFEAPYYWSVINIRTLTFFSLTEGDTYKETFNTLEELFADCKKQIEWHIKMEHPTSTFGEWEYIKVRIEKAIKERIHYD